MAEEIELKLAIAPSALASVRRHPVLAAHMTGRPHTVGVMSSYYDTPAHDLRAAGVALRLRREGGRWLQTAKGPGDVVAGLHHRAEYEWPLPRPRLDLAKLAATPWRKLFAAAAGGLKPVFRTEVARTSQPLGLADGTRATLCLDQGAIIAGRRQLPISEIEIELVDGEAWRLYELAQALAADAPIAVAHASKADRGYALAGAGEIEPARARVVRLPADASAATALAAVGADCLRQIGVNAECVAAGNDAEFVHQLRVGIRRLRSLLKFVAALIPPERIAPLDDELRWLGSAAGAVRDWDVFAAETLAPITPHLTHPQLRRALGRLKARVTRTRGAQRAAASEATRSPRVTRLLLALGALLSELASAPAGITAVPSARSLAEDALTRRDKRLRKRAKRLRHASPADRHRARIAAKKLRYAAEFFAPLYPGTRGRDYIKALIKLQDALGRLNDLATAERLLDQLAPPGNMDPGIAHAAGIARGWIAAAAAPELARGGKAWRAFAQLKPFWH